jgi:hypothetical protein
LLTAQAVAIKLPMAQKEKWCILPKYWQHIFSKKLQ